LFGVFDLEFMVMLRSLLAKMMGQRWREASQPKKFAATPAIVRSRTPVDTDFVSRFRFPAAENMIGDMGDQQLLKVIKSFSPSQPTQSISQFAGRSELLANLIVAIEEHRNHLVVFGGRGTGKTSLALALSAVAQGAGYHCAYISCTHDSSIDSIFRSALSELSVRFDQMFDPRAENADPTLTFDLMLPSGEVSPQLLADLLARIRGTRLLIVLDEYDRNENPSLNRDMTEVMKVLSDRALPVQLVIVGVGEVLDNLVGEHASIARVLYSVRLNVMNDAQIAETLNVASSHGGVRLLPEVSAAIVQLSYGRPYIARLVGLKAAKMALLRGSSEVSIADFNAGTDELLGYVTAAGFGQAARLVSSGATNLQLFVAMLSCRRDSSDRFMVGDVVHALNPRVQTAENAAAVQRAIEAVSSADLGLLTSTRSQDETLYQFIDPRAELCLSILCHRALSRDLATTVSANNVKEHGVIG
jgi:RecA/RadA recombinase